MLGGDIMNELYFLTLEEFDILLQQWNGKNIKISKHEMDDYDQVFLALDTVSYANNFDGVDDYEPVHALQLNGTGKTLTENDSFEILPTSLYEIPLDETTIYQFDGTGLALVTDRGTYTITLND